VAAALAKYGTPCEPLEATELIVVNSGKNGVEPRTSITRERCEHRLRSLLEQGSIPVVTGFIAATDDGVPTTLGRGGSDYSATIVAAALNADDVVIWTDVEGLFTADPHVVGSAHTIAEVSYREASELAAFGARVLHPKTLHALMDCGIPVWIRNTFSPKKPGTKITKQGHSNGSSVTAVVATTNTSLIKIGAGLAGAIRALSRASAAVARIQAEVLLASQVSPQDDICLVVPSAQTRSVVQSLSQEFAKESAEQNADLAIVDYPVALVTVVGQYVNQASATRRLNRALESEGIAVIASTQSSSDIRISFVVDPGNATRAQIVAHREMDVPCGELPMLAVAGKSESLRPYESFLPAVPGD